MPDAESLVLENGALQVRFDGRTGDIVSVVDRATGDELVTAPGAGGGIPGAGISVFSEKGNLGGAGQPQADTEGAQDAPGVLVASERGGEGATQALVLTIDQGGFRWIATYTLEGDEPVLARTMHVTNAGDERIVLRGAQYRWPAVSPGPDAEVLFPGNIPMGYSALAGADEPIRPLDMAGYRPQHGLAFVWSPSASRAVGGWIYSEDEYANLSVRPAAGGAAVVHDLQVLAPLEPGAQEDLAQQFLWVAHGDRDSILSTVRALHRRVGLRAPERSLAGLSTRVIYCGHPGGLPEQYFTGFGGIKAMEDYLPRLKELGVDLLWVMPVFEHGDGIKWNLYAPFNHVDISPLYGTTEDFLHMVGAARDEGIAVMLDVVPHGPPAETPQAAQYPQFAGRNEDGELTDKWGCLVFDNANPDWQRLMAEEVSTWAGPDGTVGMRIDVAGGSPPNWSAPYRPSRSTFHGGLGMMQALREGHLAKRDDVVMLPEEANGPDTFYKFSDITYDFQLLFTLYHLQMREAAPADWAANLQTLLHDQSLTLPEGALKMRFAATHDTIFNLGLMRPRDIWGPARTPAVYALCALIQGVPMIYQGEEDRSLYETKPLAPRLQKGIVEERQVMFRERLNRPATVESRAVEPAQPSFEFLSALYRARKQVPALAGGADYASTSATEGVFSCIRGSGGSSDVALVLISFNDQPVTTRVSLGGAAAGIALWEDVLAGGESAKALDGVIEVSMAPGAARLLVPAG